MRVHPSRTRPAARVPTKTDKRPASQSKTWLPPLAGWVTNEPMAAQLTESAVVIDNFWPTATGIEPRGGSELLGTFNGAATAMFEYGNDKFYIANLNNVFEFSSGTSGGGPLTGVVFGQTSGDWSSVRMTNSGGTFLTIVNGADLAKIYDGTTWANTTITGITTSLLSHVWQYSQRQFFIEKGTMSAWYLATDAIGGAATEFPLGAVFNKGGFLISGATFSSDSGDNLEDRCVFITSEGEVAVYSGTDPSSALTWSLDGVFDIGQVLDKNAIITLGGDIIFATKTGLIPLSAAVSKDTAELKLVSYSRKIEPSWTREVQLSGAQTGWSLIKWPERNMALVSFPSSSPADPRCFVVNLETKAWSRFTRWDTSSMGAFGGLLYFGTSDGELYRGDTGGMDGSKSFECRYCGAFSHLDTPGSFKVASLLRAVFKYMTAFETRLSIAKNYKPDFPSAPNAAIEASSTDPIWDVAAWDAVEWGSEIDERNIKRIWQTVTGQGDVLAPQLQITSGGSLKLDAELVALNLVYKAGFTVVA